MFQAGVFTDQMFLRHRAFGRAGGECPFLNLFATACKELNHFQIIQRLTVFYPLSLSYFFGGKGRGNVSSHATSLSGSLSQLEVSTK